MIGGMLRVIIGFVFACLAAGLTMVLFVYTPLELATELASGTRVGSRAAGAGGGHAQRGVRRAVCLDRRGLRRVAEDRQLALLCAGWRRHRLRRLPGAVLDRDRGEASIVNSYAVTAFIVTGFVAGIVYWLVSVRYAAGPTAAGFDAGDHTLLRRPLRRPAGRRSLRRVAREREVSADCGQAANTCRRGH